MKVIRGFKKYLIGYYSYAKKIDGMNPYFFVLDGIWCWLRYGCVFNQFTEGGFYKYRGYHRKKILTYRNWEKIIKLNAPSDIHYFKNKVDFNLFYQKYIGRDWLYTRNMTKTQFERFVNSHMQVIIKPIDDWEGNGIYLTNFNDEDIHALYNEYSTQNVLIEEVVNQHPMMIFNNKSVNTIRIYTTYDDAKKEAFIIKSTLRVGIGESIVDNSHSGGCSYEIDIDTGRIVSCGWSHHISGNLIHPGSNIFMPGRLIPYWSETLQMVKSAAEMMPSVKFIGWDVAITKDSPIIIEGNHDPDLDIMEFVGRSGYLPIIKEHLKF